jgi:hypothetical protein
MTKATQNGWTIFIKRFTAQNGVKYEKKKELGINGSCLTA